MKTINIYCDEGDSNRPQFLDDATNSLPAINHGNGIRLRFGIFNRKLPVDLTDYTDFRFELRQDRLTAVNLLQLTAAAAGTVLITRADFKAATAWNLELSADDDETNIFIEPGDEKRKLWAHLSALDADGYERTLGKGWFFLVRDNNIPSAPPVENPAQQYYLISAPTGAENVATIWRSGAGVPPDSLGLDNDYYLDSDTQDYYRKSAGSWGAVVGNLRGAQGSGLTWVDITLDDYLALTLEEQDDPTVIYDITDYTAG